jgi:hypothetical protein
MIMFSRDNHGWFEHQLNKLAPIISKLPKRTRIVWWTQNPIIESYTEIKEFSNYITIQKLISYERSARRILRSVRLY